MPQWWRSAARTTRYCRTFHTIQAVPREISGHRIAVRERTQGRIPAVVFSQTYLQTNPEDPSSIAASASVTRKLLLTTERKQIKAILSNVELPFFCSTTFPLQIRAGSGSSTILDTKRVLPIKVHRDEQGNILNLVFVWAVDGTELKVDIPIVYKGEDISPGLKKGGSLNKIRPSLRFLCLAQHIPPKIEVDLSNLDVGDKVSIHDVDVHPSLKLLWKNESIPVCKILTTDVERNN